MKTKEPIRSLFLQASKIVFFLLAFLSFPHIAVSQQIQWVGTGGKGTKNAHAKNICTDILGNSYFSGMYTDTLNIANRIFVTDSNIYGSFILSYNKTGNLRWSLNCSIISNGKKHDYPSYIIVNSISADTFGNAYVSISTSLSGGDTAKINGQKLPAYLWSFIIKCDSSGKTQWLKKPEFESGKIFIDKNNNFYQCGDQNSSTIYDSASIGGKKTRTPFNNNHFISGSDSSGKINWVQNMISTKNSVQVFNDYSGTDNFGHFYQLLTYPAFDSSYSNDSFYVNKKLYLTPIKFGYTKTYNSIILKYNSTGDLIWSKEINILNGTPETQMSIDKDGNIYYAAIINGDSISGGTHYVYNSNYLLLKMDSSGKKVWDKNLDPRYTVSLATDNIGHIYCCNGIILRYDSNGQNLKIYDSIFLPTNLYFYAVFTNDSGIFFAGNFAGKIYAGKYLISAPNPTY